MPDLRCGLPRIPERTFTVTAQEETDKIQMELYNNHQGKGGCVTGGHERAETEHRSQGLLMQDADRTLNCGSAVFPATSAGKAVSRLLSPHV